MNILTILFLFILSSKGIIKNDFLVNNDIAGGWQSFPKVAINDSGKIVITWQDYRNGSADIFSYSDIYAQIYNPDGTVQDTNFRVNTDFGIGGQWEPAVSIDNSGNFIIAWEDIRNGNSDIYAQRFNSNGIPQDTNFRINTDIGASKQQGTSLIITKLGDFIVVWEDIRNGNSDIYAQLLNSNGIPQDSNFKVNFDIGTASQQKPSVAGDSSGNFIIVWQDDRNGNSDIYAQRYNSNCAAQDTNFKVNADVGAACQQRPSVAMEGSGGFIIVWQDDRDGNFDIYAQKYNLNCTLKDTNFKVNSDIDTSDQFGPSVSIAKTGIFVITWLNGGDNNSSIYAQMYDSSITPQGVSFKVNDNAVDCAHWVPSISMNKPGNFVITWHDWRSGDANIYAQRYDSYGNSQGGNFIVNEDPGTSEQAYPALAMNDSGSFVATWRDERDVWLRIYAQRYSSDGTAQGMNFRVNDDTGKTSHEGPTIAMNNSGDFIISWQDWRAEYWDIYAQRYAPDGTPRGINFKVNDDTGINYNTYPSAAIDDSGNFIIVWLDRRNGDFDIYAQRYDANGNPQGANFKVNDDAGTANQWCPCTAVDKAGNFIIAWDDEREGSGDTYAQMYESDGSLRGVNFRVNDDTGMEEQWYQSIAIGNSGNFVIAWQDYRNGNWDIYLQSYDSIGTAQGGNIRANDDFGTKDQMYSSIAISPDGNRYVISWTDFRNIDNDPEIFGQKYENGNPTGNNFQVNEQDIFPYNHQITWYFSTACSQNSAVFTWMDNRRHKGWDIYAKLTDWNFVGIEDKEHEKTLSPLIAYPTIFHKKITLRGAKEIEIYNITGSFITKVNTDIWDGKDAFGKDIKPGIYFLKPKNGKPVKVIKIKSPSDIY